MDILKPNLETALQLIRKLHAYIGYLIAPSVLFFAFSGTLQLFSLHETHGPYHAPPILQMLGNLHKDQILSKPEKHPSTPMDASPTIPAANKHLQPSAHTNADAPKVKTYILKWYFALVGVSLFVSTFFGLWMGLRVTRTPRISWGLLIAGAAIPLLILIL